MSVDVAGVVEGMLVQAARMMDTICNRRQEEGAPVPQKHGKHVNKRVSVVNSWDEIIDLLL